MWVCVASVGGVCWLCDAERGQSVAGKGNRVTSYKLQFTFMLFFFIFYFNY